MIGDLVRIGQLFYPALIVLYVIGCQMWNTPMDPWLLGIGGVATFLTNSYAIRHDYHAGTIEVEETVDGIKRYTLSLDSDPEDLDKKKRISFDVEVSRE